MAQEIPLLKLLHLRKHAVLVLCLSAIHTLAGEEGGGGGGGGWEEMEGEGLHVQSYK